jgi:hypothetical protein
MRTDRQTDMTTLTVALLQIFGNAPKILVYVVLPVCTQVNYSKIAKWICRKFEAG